MKDRETAEILIKHFYPDVEVNSVFGYQQVVNLMLKAMHCSKGTGFEAARKIWIVPFDEHPDGRKWLYKTLEDFVKAEEK